MMFVINTPKVGKSIHFPSLKRYSRVHFSPVIPMHAGMTGNGFALGSVRRHIAAVRLNQSPEPNTPKSH